MLIIAGHIQVEPTERDGYVAECVSIVEAARASVGCIDFAITPDSVEPGRVNVFERWQSDEELMSFRGSGPDEGQKAQILGAQVSKYRISGVEAP